MKPIIKLYIKLFLINGFGFGVFKSIFNLVSSDGFSFREFLFNTFFFGIGISLYLVYSIKKQLKEIGIQKIKEEHLKTTQDKTIESLLSKIQLIEKLKNSEETKNMNIKEVGNEILLSTAFSFKSSGEKIKIILKSENKSSFTYLVSSKSRLKLNLFNYTNNIKNIKIVEAILRNDNLENTLA